MRFPSASIHSHYRCQRKAELWCCHQTYSQLSSVRNSTTWIAKLNNDTLVQKSRKFPSSLQVLKAAKGASLHSTTAATSIEPSQRWKASFLPGTPSSRSSYDAIGFSLLAASASVFLLSLFVSSTETEQQGSDHFRSTACQNNKDSRWGSSVLATSSLYFDPSVSFIYQHGSGYKEESSRNGDGARSRGDEDDDSDGEDLVSRRGLDGVTTSSSAAFEGAYDLSIRAIKGKRLTMEDTYFVGPGGRFAAVFDGHGGPLVSSYLQENLYKLATEKLRRKQWELDDDDAGAITGTSKQNKDMKPSTASIASHVAALRSAFEEAEEQVLKNEDWNGQGSTAVAVWVHETRDGSRTLVSANVGDSRAILSRQGQAVELTRDHKPNEEREKARIKRHGGKIEWDALAKVHRVECLSLSRAIGDSYAKPIVSGEADIKLFPVVEEKDEFMVLASDGLWDVMSSQDVVSYVRDRFQSELARKELTNVEDIENCRVVLRRNMARSIVREAVRRGTGDNVCVLIVWLNDNLITSSQPQRSR